MIRLNWLIGQGSNWKRNLGDSSVDAHYLARVFESFFSWLTALSSFGAGVAAVRTLFDIRVWLSHMDGKYWEHIFGYIFICAEGDLTLDGPYHPVHSRD